MPISHFILHQISREAPSGGQVTLRQQEIETSERLDVFVDELRSAYLGRLGREHGSFASDEEGACLARLLQQVDEGRLGFVQLTEAFVQQMLQGIESLNIEFSGHLLFIQEQRHAGDLFYLFVVQHRSSTAIGPDLELQPVHYIDLGASLMVVKVDLSEWKRTGASAYLSLTTPRGNRELSALFRQLTGFGHGVNKVDDTRLFLESVEAFSKSVSDEQATELRHQVVDFCMEQEQQDEPVAMDALSRSLTAVDSGAFSNYLADSLPGQSELLVDRKSLRQYVKFSGRERDLAISFSSSQLNNRVHYNQDTDTLSVSGLPKALRDQLLAHLGS